MSYQHIIPYNNMLQDAKRAGGPKKYKEQIFFKGRNQGIKEGQRIGYAKATILGLSILGITKGVTVLKSKKKKTTIISKIRLSSVQVITKGEMKQ